METDVPAIKYKKWCGEEEKSESQYGKNGIISLSSVLKGREGSEEETGQGHDSMVTTRVFIC